MSDPEAGTKPATPTEQEDSGPQSSTVNLKLLYTLIALALLAAMTFALMIVKPFYHRHL